MSARRAHRIVAAAVAAAVAVAGVACGGDREPLRVGVLVECDSIFASTRPGALAGAALPLVERGAKPGAEPGDIEGARVAGRAIEIVPACSQVTRFPRLIAETRWLVESKGADVVVGPLGGPEGAMMRRVAAKYPDVTFLVGTGGAQETTLRDPRPKPLPVYARRRPERGRARGVRLREAGLAPRRGRRRGVSRWLGGHGRLRRGVLLSGGRDRRARLRVSPLHTGPSSRRDASCRERRRRRPVRDGCTSRAVPRALRGGRRRRPRLEARRRRAAVLRSDRASPRRTSI